MKPFVFLAVVTLSHVYGHDEPLSDMPVFSNQTCNPMDVVFVLDSSRSMGRDGFKKQLEFTNQIVDRLNVGPGPQQTRIGAISIGYSYILHFYLRTFKGKTKDDVKRAITNLRYRYSYETNTGAAMFFLRKYMFQPFFGGRPGATRMAIVITDGLSQDPKKTKSESLLAKKKGIKIFAIGVDLKKEDELINIASEPSDLYALRVNDFNALGTILDNLPKSSCEVAAMTRKPLTTTKLATLPPLKLVTEKIIPPDTKTSSTEELMIDSLSSAANSPVTESVLTAGPDLVSKIIDHQLTEQTTDQPTYLQESTDTVHSEQITTDGQHSHDGTNSRPMESTTIPGRYPLETTNQDTVELTTSTGQFTSKSPEINHAPVNTESMKTTTPFSNVIPVVEDKLFNSNEIPQGDEKSKQDKEIWSMLTEPTKPPFLLNELPMDIAISDDPKHYCGGKNADVYFALDSSNSIWPEDFKKQVDFVNDLVDTFDFRNNKTRVGIIVYSTDIYMKVALDSGWTKRQIKRQIDAIEYISGLTNTSDAIRFIRTYGFTEGNDRKDAIKIAIILTDGISRDPIATKRESILSREEGITLFAIGIGKDIDKTELKRIANDPDDKFVFHVNNFAALASIRSIVAVSACGVVPDQPSNLLSCGADVLADVIFTYDAPSLGARKAGLLTSFVHDITRALQTAPGKLQVGRRTDNCPAISDIDLTSESDRRSFSYLQYPGIETLLSKLGVAFPNRVDSKNLVVLFVDESTQNIEMASRVLKGDMNFHVMVVAVGDPSMARLASDLASLPHTDYLVNIPSYMELGSYRYEFLQKLCYLITNKSMYLRDARVRAPRVP